MYSGDEFSEKCFPPDVFLHDVELIDPTTPGLHAKPYPCTGIRLPQLKATISDLEKSGVLVKGDSEFTSPVFYVLKKASGTKTASKGRLRYDYRKLNSCIKSQHFPLILKEQFFQNASQFKKYCIVDISNAFLSIGLTERQNDILP